MRIFNILNISAQNNKNYLQQSYSCNSTSKNYVVFGMSESLIEKHLDRPQL